MENSVPCKSCKLCCQGGQAIYLFPKEGDNVSEYETMKLYNPVMREEGTALKFKDNGDCVYLGKEGCTIYDRRPVICRSYDCRKQFLMYPKKMRKEVMNKPLYNAAKERINTLPQAERKELRAIAQLRNTDKVRGE